MRHDALPVSIADRQGAADLCSVSGAKQRFGLDRIRTPDACLAVVHIFSGQNAVFAQGFDEFGYDVGHGLPS